MRVVGRGARFRTLIGQYRLYPGGRGTLILTFYILIAKNKIQWSTLSDLKLFFKTVGQSSRS